MGTQGRKCVRHLKTINKKMHIKKLQPITTTGARSKEILAHINYLCSKAKYILAPQTFEGQHTNGSIVSFCGLKLACIHTPYKVATYSIATESYKPTKVQLTQVLRKDCIPMTSRLPLFQNSPSQ